MSDTTPSAPIREAAEKVVNELQAWFDPARDSEYNMGPYPDPVAALVAFADTVIADDTNIVTVPNTGTWLVRNGIAEQGHFDSFGRWCADDDCEITHA